MLDFLFVFWSSFPRFLCPVLLSSVLLCSILPCLCVCLCVCLPSFLRAREAKKKGRIRAGAKDNQLRASWVPSSVYMMRFVSREACGRLRIGLCCYGLGHVFECRIHILNNLFRQGTAFDAGSHIKGLPNDSPGKGGRKGV